MADKKYCQDFASFKQANNMLIVNSLEQGAIDVYSVKPLIVYRLNTETERLGLAQSYCIRLTELFALLFRCLCSLSAPMHSCYAECLFCAFPSPKSPYACDKFAQQEASQAHLTP